MTELEVMERAKNYIENLANGINPLDGSVVPDTDIVNNVRISRCLFYVSGVLEKLIANGGNITAKKTPKKNFFISFEDIQKFEFSDTPIPLSEVAKRINDIVNDDNMKKLAYKHIADWLVSIEMLYVEIKPDGKTVKKLTESGRSLGVSTEIRTGMRGEYETIVYNKKAQQFIVDNIEAIIAMMYNK